MSDRIKLLPEVVANQIAAGEVVNRPASAVKELMENAIDAGATTIAVNFREGGRDLIQVVDNGCGMSPVDARLAFDRHATSKIRSVDDIYRLRTFGFRGEALASIAAVAQVELRTRQAEDELGTVTEINGGQFVSQTPVACPPGSQFLVRNLFYNVPARRRCMDKPIVSAGRIKSEFQRVALCNPQVRFELYNNDAPVYHLPPASLAGRIVDVAGPSMKHNLLEVEADTTIVKLRGYVGRPEAARKTKPDQYLFVNGRYFRSAYFLKAVQRAYDKLIPDEATPACFLYFEIEPDRIDVNVHPQKTEVKFADEEAVWQIVHAAVRETLGKTGAVPLMDFSDEGRVEIPVMGSGGNTFYTEPPVRSDTSYNPFEAYPDADEPLAELPKSPRTGGGSRAAVRSAAGGGIVAEPEEPAETPEADGGEFDDFRSGDTYDFVQASDETAEQPALLEAEPAGFADAFQMGGGLALARYGDRTVAVDLRRARECVLYDRYRNLLQHGAAVSQQLLFPERLVLSEGEYALWEEHEADFAALGFEIEGQGGCTIVVNGIPADLPLEAMDTLLSELLRLFEEPHSGEELRRDRMAALLARSGARPVGWLPAGELHELLDALALCEARSYTPSGKRVLAEVTPDELRARFS